ncbi:fibronectin-like [Pecten maximus]|uniref:fibronectin-like n=1 Tax=Pecten maximus TaxID=6579 RepID=UPI00145874E8|nr:fibronectin-like [Pecten maximus]
MPWTDLPVTGHDGYRVSYNGGDIHDNRTFTDITNDTPTLSISSLTPGTTFTFHVFTLSNGLESEDYYGTQTSTIPNRPTALAVTNRTIASVTLTVTPGDGGHDGYRVSYNGGDIHDNRTFTDITNDTPTLSISSLTPGTTFTFHVFTLSNGLESEDYYGTQTSTIPNRPTALAVTNRTIASVTLTVTPGDGGHDGYRVSYNGGDIHDNRTFTDITNDTPTLSISSLTPGTTFTFHVFTLSNGLESEDYYGTQTSTIPNRPTALAVTNRTIASVTLTVTPGDGGHDGYRVSYNGGDIHDNRTFTDITNDTPTLSISSLTPGTTFTFHVFTLSNGLESEDYYGTQTSTIPNRPTALAVTNRTIASVTLTVTPGDGGHDGYRVSYNGGDIHDNRTFTDITNDTPTLSISSLTPGTTFTFHVFTLSNGLESEDYYGTQTSTIPNRPTALAVTNRTIASVTLTVTPGDGGHDGYRVSYNGGDIHDNRTFTDITNDTPTLSISSLTPGTTFTFHVFTLSNGLESEDYYGTQTSTIPNRPTALAVTNRTIASVTLTVTPGDGGHDGYRVSYNGGDIHDNRTFTDITNDTPTLSISSLTPGTTFTFHVFTLSNGLESEDYYGTQTSTIPNRPTALAVTNRTIASVTLTVTPGDGGHDGYRVSYNGGDIHDNRTFTDITNDTPTLSISSLTPGTTFTFHVFTLSNGLESEDYYGTQTSTIPNRPTALAVTNRTIASVTLTVTPGDGGHDGYRVSYNGGDIHDNRTFTDITNDTPTLSISSLTPGTTFTFHVFTLSNGLESEDYYGTQTSTIPNRPTALAVTNRTIASVTLTVTPGDGGHDGYRVSYNGGDIHDNRTFTDITNDTPTLSISSLTPGTTFTFHVFTLSNGLESEDYYGTQTSTIPNRPTVLAVTERNTTSVTLSVTPGNRGHDGYRVEYVGGDIRGNRTFPNITNPSILVIGNLTSGTTFTFNVFTRANGLESEDYYGTQASTNPTTPEDVKVTNQSTTSVTLTVTPGDTGYGGFLVLYGGYNLTFTLDDKGSTHHDLTVNTGLTPGTTYTFQVFTLYNDSISDNSTNTTGSTVPNIPSALAVTDRTTTSVTLTVTPGNGGHDGYRVTYVGDGINRNRTFPNKIINRPTLVIGNLTSGTTFTFNVFTRADGLESESYYGTQASTSDNANSKMHEGAIWRKAHNGKRQTNLSGVE